MYELTVEQIAAATAARIDRAYEAMPHLLEAMNLCEITTALRAGMFLANIGHETCGFKWLHEIWGPTPQQLRYERDFMAPWPASIEQARSPAFTRNRLAFELGNLELGDGRRFAGGGYLHSTGRSNAALLRDRLRRRFPTRAVPDFELEPEQLATHEWGALAAADYVEWKGANAYADAGDFDGYCDVINRGRKTAAIGDSNGWEDRRRLWVGINEGRSLA
jgi:putative chitinase